MKLRATIAAFALLAGPAIADPVHGTWASPKNDAGASLQVNLKDCGGSICGTITKVSGGGDQSVVGKQMVWNMTSQGGGKYKGKIWAPDSGKTYNGRMQLNGAALKMSGCVLGVCRGETFSRVN